jgi:RNA recognition motif-containing protein
LTDYRCCCAFYRARCIDRERHRPAREGQFRGFRGERGSPKRGQGQKTEPRSRSRSRSPRSRWRRERRDKDSNFRPAPSRRRFRDAYEAELGAGFDEARDKEDFPYRERDRRRRDVSEERSLKAQPSQWIRIHNLPPDTAEEELRSLFAPIPGVAQLVLSIKDSNGPLAADTQANTQNRDDKNRNQSNDKDRKTTAMLHMTALPAAQALMDSEWRNNAYYRDCRLQLAYTPPPSPPRGVLKDTDWVCPACSSLNFARRSTCYHCRVPRTEEAESIDPEAPSHVLKITNLEMQTDEAILEEYIKPLAPIRVIRLARDKMTGESRGVAFVYFFSVRDATAVMEKLDGSIINGQTWRLRMSYARDRMNPAAPAPAGEAQGTGLQGEAVAEGDKDKEKAEAEEMTKIPQKDSSAGWEPQAFDEKLLDISVESGSVGLLPGEINNRSADVDMTKTGSVEGYEYDAQSGYLKDTVSGFLYDVQTGYYFHPVLAKWGSRDPASGEFIPYVGEDDRQPVDKLKTQSDHAPPGLPTEKDAEAVVIGAPPKLDPHALQVKASLPAQEKSTDQKEEDPTIIASTNTSTTKRTVQGVVHRGKWAERAAARKASKERQSI